MKMDNNKKKIGLLAVVLIILAGIVIVCLKGFNVSLMYRSHETINFIAGKEMIVSDVEDLVKEVLQDKKFDVRGIEEFEDAVSISTENFTVEEKENLVNKINEKYGLENKVEDVKIQTVSNVRLRDMFAPYFKSTVIVFVFLVLYMILRYKSEDMKKVLKSIVSDLVKVVVVQGVVIALIAIIRLPISALTIPVLLTVLFVHLVMIMTRREKERKEELKKVKKTKKKVNPDGEV